METLALPDEVRTAVERIGTADLVVGLATAGPSPSAPAVGGAVRAGLDAHFAGQSAAVVHVDQTPAEETPDALASALGPVRRIRVPVGGHTADGPLDWAQAVRTVLTVGRALEARAIVMLNAELASTTGDWLRGLATPVLKDDFGLVLPIYHRYRYDGTLTQALVVPLMRSLFGRRLAHPLAEEFGCSGPAADAFLEHPVWQTDLGHHGLEFWLPAAAIERGLTLGQAVLGPRIVGAVQPPAPLGRTVGRVAGALFALAEESESYWLDVRGSEPVVTFGTPPEPLPGGPAVDPERMQVGFVQGVRDLLPVWERILAPENLGEVLELSDRPLERFRFSDRLWTRVVYDFLLAYRARVVYRSHAVQSLAPLYLGRAASVILETRARPPATLAQSAARLGGMFEEDKSYLVDRWR
jgi:glucosylglycerate synthase